MPAIPLRLEAFSAAIVMLATVSAFAAEQPKRSTIRASQTKRSKSGISFPIAGPHRPTASSGASLRRFSER